MINYEKIKEEIVKEYPNYLSCDTPDVIASFFNNQIIDKFVEINSDEYYVGDYCCGYVYDSANRYRIIFQLGSDIYNLSNNNNKEEIFCFIDGVCKEDTTTIKAKKVWNNIRNHI